MGLLTSIVSGGGGGGTAPTAPESIVVGTGSYTVPALKFAVVSATTSSSGSGTGYYSNGHISPQDAKSSGSGSASGDSNQAAITAGSTISTSLSNPTGSTISSIEIFTKRFPHVIRETISHAIVYIDGIPICSSYASASSSMHITSISLYTTSISARTTHAGQASWVAQIYPV